MYRTKTTPALLLSVSLFAAGTAGAATIGDTDVKYSGYIKADAASSYYSDGTLASGTLGRDFYIPSLTPVGGSSEGAQFDSNLRQSRFRFATTTPTASLLLAKQWSDIPLALGNLRLKTLNLPSHHLAAAEEL